MPVMNECTFFQPNSIRTLHTARPACHARVAVTGCKFRDISGLQLECFRTAAHHAAQLMPVHKAAVAALCLAISASLVQPATAQAACNATCQDAHRLALQQLYNSTSGPQWYTSTGWTPYDSGNVSADVHCSWFGITCCGADGTAQTPDGELLCSAPGSVAYMVSDSKSLQENHLMYSPQLLGRKRAATPSCPIQRHALAERASGLCLRCKPVSSRCWRLQMGRWWVLVMHAYLDHPWRVFALAAVQRLPHNGLSGTLPDAALGTLADYFIGINFNGKLHDVLGCVCLLLDVEC